MADRHGLSLTFVTVSDAGGPGTARRGGAQGAWLVLAAEGGIRHNLRSKVSLLSWRSQRLKWAIASTVAAETLSLSGAVAEAQWLQVLWRDLEFGDIPKPDWCNANSPFTVALAKECHLGEAASSISVVDAKSIFDNLSKNCSGSRADRRNSIELAVIRDALSSIGSTVRWVPHPQMCADPLTKIDPSRGNHALQALLSRGTLVLVDEDGLLDDRSRDEKLKSRTKAASRRALEGGNDLAAHADYISTAETSGAKEPGTEDSTLNGKRTSVARLVPQNFGALSPHVHCMSIDEPPRYVTNLLSSPSRSHCVCDPSRQSAEG